MIELFDKGVYLVDGTTVVTKPDGLPAPEEARENTITYQILPAPTTPTDRKGQNAHPFRRHDEPRHHIRGHHPDGTCIGTGEIPDSLRDDQLSQLALRCRRYDQ